jgi:hypothetical protein
VGADLVNHLTQCQFVYFITDTDYARVGRRVFIEHVASDLAEAVALKESRSANPLHLGYQTPGSSINRSDLPRG